MSRPKTKRKAMNRMTLEDLIYQRLIQDATLAGALAKYHSAPAVFYQTAPDDTAAGWQQRKQYPRIDYVVDYISNPERKTSGLMTLNLLSTEDGLPPEELEPTVRSLLCGVFLCPTEDVPYCMAWARSDAFEQQTKSGGLITGITIQFDVFAFPSQISADPDPVLAMNHFIETAHWNAEIIGGKKTTDQVFIPTKTHPAFYFRLETMQLNRETNTVAWMDATIACHIFAGGHEIEWLKALTDRLALAGEVTMLDGSPMFLRNIKADSTMNALSTGQIRLFAHFGLLRRPAYSHPLVQPQTQFQSLT